VAGYVIKDPVIDIGLVEKYEQADRLARAVLAAAEARPSPA